MSEQIRISEVTARPFHSWIRRILAAESPHWWFRGGRGSTKSTFVSLVIILLIHLNPGLNVVVLRKVADTLRGSVFSQMMWAISCLGLDSRFHSTTSPMEIVYKPTGQRIIFKGVDRPEKVKSLKVAKGYIGVVWFEEIDQFAGMREVRNLLQSLLRGGAKAWVLYSFNPPRSRDNWVNKELMRPAKTLPDGRPERIIIDSCYLDVPEDWLGEHFVSEAEMLRDLDETAYKHEYLGEVVGTGGNVFENVELREVTDEEIASFDRTYNGVDWGYFPDPWALTRSAYLTSQRTLITFDEDGGQKLSNEQSAERVKRHLSDKDGNVRRERVTCDSAEPKSIDNYRALGIDARGAVKGPGSVEHLTKWLATRAKWVIDPKRCPKLAAEAMAYEHEMNRDGEYMTGYPDHDNHWIDATRYAVEAIAARRHNV